MSKNNGKVLDALDDKVVETDSTTTEPAEPADAIDTADPATETSETTGTETNEDPAAAPNADPALKETAPATETRTEKTPETQPARSRMPTIPGRMRTVARRLMPGLVALLIVGLAAATGYLGWQYQHTKAIDASSAAAEQAATTYAVTLTSVDTAALDANFQAVLDGSTGEFRDTYTKSSAQLRQLLIDHKATGHGVVLQSAVKSATEDEVVVLLFVDQTVTNTEMPDPRVDRSRIVMTMRKVDGQWKAAKVDIP